MENFKGTKGKWEVSEKLETNVHGVALITIDFENAKECVDIYLDSRLPYEEALSITKANAQLISCAPEMLKLLEETFNLTDKIQMPTEFEIAQLRNKLFNLIKKATEI